MIGLILGALVATSTPNAARPATGSPATAAAVAVVVAVPATATATQGMAPPELAAMFKLFDTFFPVQPEPDPVRLAAARITVAAMLPPGTFGEAIGDTMSKMVERILETRESDLPFPVRPKRKGATAAALSDETIHQSLVANDPLFDERMRLTRAAVAKELVTFSAIIEPKLRDGLARAVSRRFDQRQLADINTFFATDSGKAMGKQFLGLWFDPDLMRSSIAAMPEVVIAMPGAMKRVEASTAHLPKPPQDTPPAKSKRSK